MNTSKAIQLLQSFNTEDWRECGDHLNGALRKGHECLKLFQYLKKYRDNWQSSGVKLEKIKTKLFPNITSKSYTNIFSKLSLSIEDYLVIHAVRKDRSNYRLTLLKELSERGLYNLFDKAAKKLEHDLVDEQHLDLFDEYNLLKLNHLRFFSDNPIKNDFGEIILLELKNSNHNFYQEYGFLLESMNLHFKEVSTKMKKGFNPRNAGSTLNILLQNLNDFTKKRTDQLFENLYALLMDETSFLAHELRVIIIELLIHDGHHQIKKGVLSNIEELLNLYEYGFNSGILLSNNRITENKFVNVVSTACACGKYMRAEHIISNYSHMLIESSRGGTVQISKAQLDFYQGKYEDVIDKVRDFPFNSLWQNIRRRWMLLCAYCKVMDGDVDFMQNRIKNYNGYFYNNKLKLSTAAYEGSLNLSRLIWKMINEKDSDVLLNFTKSCDHLIYRSWVEKEIGAGHAPIS